MIEAEIRNQVDKVLGLDLYLLLILDKKKGRPITIGQNIPSFLEEEIIRSALGRNVLGPFEEDNLTLKGVSLFESDAIAGAFISEQEVIDNIAPEDLAWLKLITIEHTLTNREEELKLSVEKLGLAEKSISMFNYDYFKKQLETEWERARRYNRCLSLVLLDIDDFQSYEETFGMEQKELALAEMSKLITSQCRQSDIVARYIGDELAIILPETDASGGFVAAERIRETLYHHYFPGRQSMNDVKLTASLGVVNYPLNTADMEGLTREVEAALYKAKTTGRNRVCGPELPA